LPNGLQLGQKKEEKPVKVDVGAIGTKTLDAQLTISISISTDQRPQEMDSLH
jgi:hypothetical protein